MADLSPQGHDLLTRMLTSHAYRERLAGDRFGQALDKGFPPSPEERERVERALREEYDHYQGCLSVGRQFGIDVKTLADGRMGREPVGIPPFGNWLDVLLAQVLNDAAGYFVMEGLRDSKIEPYAELAGRIMRDEAGHLEHGKTLLVPAYRARADDRAGRQLVTHLDAAVRCCGRPYSDGDREAVRLGLKTRPAADTLKEFGVYADAVLNHLGRADLVPLSEKYLK